MKYKILEHPADIKIQAFGKTKQKLFLNAMKGMNAVLKSKSKTQNAKRKISVKSLDLNALLVDFLSEALYLPQVNKEVYNDVKFTKFNDKQLEAELTGNKIESFGEDIKGVTYHDLKIEKENNQYQVTILFDI